LAYTARLRYSGYPGLQWNATVQRQTDMTQGDDEGIGIDDISGTLFETNVSYRRGGFGLRALYAAWDFDNDIERLNPGADEQSGWYVEPSYTFENGFGVFARYGGYDLTAGSSVASNERKQFDFGVNYWLHENVVLKADFQRQDNDNGADNDGFNLGVGYSF
jgi:predicted porin